jgi:hypothetical protein
LLRLQWCGLFSTAIILRLAACVKTFRVSLRSSSIIIRTIATSAIIIMTTISPIIGSRFAVLETIVAIVVIRVVVIVVVEIASSALLIVFSLIKITTVITVESTIIVPEY